MLVILAVFLTPQIGSFSNAVIEIEKNSKLFGFSKSLATGFLLVSPFASFSVINNKYFDHYYFAGPLVNELSLAIQTNACWSSSLYRLRNPLYQLSEGHLRPSLWSKTPLIASSYAHNIWSYRQIIPEEFLKT